MTRPSGFRHVEVGHIEGKPGGELLAAPLGGCRRWRLRGGSACRPKALQATASAKIRKKTSKSQPEGPWREELTRFFGVDLTAIAGISVLTGLTS